MISSLDVGLGIGTDGTPKSSHFTNASLHSQSPHGASRKSGNNSHNSQSSGSGSSGSGSSGSYTCAPNSSDTSDRYCSDEEKEKEKEKEKMEKEKEKKQNDGKRLSKQCVNTSTNGTSWKHCEQWQSKYKVD